MKQTCRPVLLFCACETLSAVCFHVTFVQIGKIQPLDNSVAETQIIAGGVGREERQTEQFWLADRLCAATSASCAVGS